MSPDEVAKKHELMQLYAPRCPMIQLPDRYRVTKKKPKPPILHFAFPHLDDVLFVYAHKYDLTHYIRPGSFWPSPATLLSAAAHLSKYVEYDLTVAFPFRITSESSSILVLYDNYTRKCKRLVEEDEEDVIRMVQEALGYDRSVRPKWYFDMHDPWQPGDGEGDENTNQKTEYGSLQS